VQPSALHDGLPLEMQFFDEPRLEVVDETNPAAGVFDNPFEVDPDLMDTR
jgi:hypothetical protein